MTPSRFVTIAVLTAVAIGAPLTAQDPMPRAGRSAKAAPPGVSIGSVPSLRRLADSALAGRFRVAPGYKRAAQARVSVVGTYQLGETSKASLTGAFSPGFLPVTLIYSDGRCWSLNADYSGDDLSSGRLAPVGCAREYRPVVATPPSPPADRRLRLIGSAWGFAAWANDREHTTIVTAPDAPAFEPLFIANMRVTAIAAMNSPDAPLANVTLVGRINGKVTAVTLLVSY